MRFRIGQPEVDESFEPEEHGWTPMKEPPPFLFIAVATPVAILLAWLVLTAWQAGGSSESTSYTVSGPQILIGFPLLILCHELIHGFAYPGFGTAVRVVIGFWPSRFLFYAATNDPVSRNRMLIVYLAPLLVLSVLPLLLNRLLNVESFPLLAVAAANAFCSGGDALVFPMILAQISSGAILKNKGWRTWWKLPRGDENDSATVRIAQE